MSEEITEAEAEAKAIEKRKQYSFCHLVANSLTQFIFEFITKMSRKYTQRLTLFEGRDLAYRAAFIINGEKTKYGISLLPVRTVTEKTLCINFSDCIVCLISIPDGVDIFDDSVCVVHITKLEELGYTKENPFRFINFFGNFTTKENCLLKHIRDLVHIIIDDKPFIETLKPDYNCFIEKNNDPLKSFKRMGGKLIPLPLTKIEDLYVKNVEHHEKIKTWKVHKKDGLEGFNIISLTSTDISPVEKADTSTETSTDISPVEKAELSTSTVKEAELSTSTDKEAELSTYTDTDILRVTKHGLLERLQVLKDVLSTDISPVEKAELFTVISNCEKALQI